MFGIWRAPTSRHMAAFARLLTTEVQGLDRQLAAASELLTLVQLPGAGRGLVAAKDISQGTVVHREFPMLLALSPHALDQACYHCLKPLPPNHHQPSQQQPTQEEEDANSKGATRTAEPVRFCSSECRSTANREYWQVERLSDFGPLREACRQGGEKLPLVAARLACMLVTQRQSGGVDILRGGRVGGSGGGAKVPRGSAVEDLGQLCYANVPSPPPPWRATYELLLQGLLSHPSNSSLGSASAWLQTAPQAFGLDWYCRVLSRLHINVFRVDTVPELPALDRAALLRAAAGLISGASVGAPGAPPGRHAPGAAVYLLASMLNHSCEPNLEVAFPHNNAVVALSAARDIARGEQLTICYVDQDMAHEPRRAALEFSYGFECKCQRCREGR